MYFYSFDSICIEKKTDKNYAGIRVAEIVQSVSIVGIVQLLNEIYLNLLY